MKSQVARVEESGGLKAFGNQVFLEGLRIILRPVFRYCLRHSIKFQDIVENCKVVYIQVAESELRRRGSAVSSSRISVMTGLHRPDINRLGRDKEPPKQRLDIVSRVILQWQNDQRFITKDKTPKTLKAEGDPSDFSQLVRAVQKDLNPYTVLHELERLSVVERTGLGVRLIKRMHATKDIREGLTWLANDTQDLMSAVEENLSGNLSIPNYHLKTEFNNIAVEAVPIVREWALRVGSALHEEARTFLAQYDCDLNPKFSQKQGGVRVLIAGFSKIELYPE